MGNIKRIWIYFHLLENIAHPFKEVLHIGCLGVDNDAVNLLVFDLLEYGAIAVGIRLPQMYLHIPVVRRPDQFPQLYETWNKGANAQFAPIFRHTAIP